MKFVDESGHYKLPDLFIIGAAKSGTTTLAYLLHQHPLVSMPLKEPGFMAYYGKKGEVPPLVKERQVFEFSAYKELYEKVPNGHKICDSSVVYLNLYQDSIKNLLHFYGKKSSAIKLVAILRQPVDRSFSHYMMLVKNGREDLSFKEAIKDENVTKRIGLAIGFDYLRNSLYYDRIAAFKKAFPQIKVYLTDDLKNAEYLAKDMFEYFELDYPENINLDMKLNPSGIPKNKRLNSMLNKSTPVKTILKKMVPENWHGKIQEIKSEITARNIVKVKVDPLIRSDLTSNYFRADILKLQDLIGRDLSHWM